jgi:XRE family transcriptional regulator, master regulator for biofilm formation
MKKSLGKRIKTFRLRKGISITKLAQKAKISKGYLSSIESHKTNPSMHIVNKLAEALEVPVEQLLSIPIEPLDPEWVELVAQARELGLKKDEIRAFLAYEAWKHTVKEEV